MSFRAIAQQIGELVEQKNAAYGNSFAKTGEFLGLLYPNGILPEQYGDALLITRIFDKLQRIATDRDALGESPYRDIAGYGILGASLHERITMPLQCQRPGCSNLVKHPRMRFCSEACVLADFRAELRSQICEQCGKKRKRGRPRKEKSKD